MPPSDYQNEIIKFLLKQNKLGESVTTIGLPGLAGINIIFTNFNNQIKIPKGTKFIKEILITQTDLKNFLIKLKSFESKKIVISIGLYVKYKEDCNWFIDELNDFYNKNQTNLKYYIFSTVGTIYKSLSIGKKITSKSLLILKNLDKENSYKQINEVSKKTDSKIHEDDCQKILELSGGHIGFLKRITLLKVNYPDLELEVSSLLKKEEILNWINEIILDMPEEISNILKKYINLKKVDTNERDLLEKFGYLKDGEVFSPLLETYLEKYFKQSLKIPISLQKELSNRETNLLQELITNQNSFIEKDSVAKLIWGDDWLDKYSDWAINQFLHRFKKKLEKFQNYSLIIKRGKGISLQI